MNYADESVVVEKVCEQLLDDSNKSAIVALGILIEVNLLVNAQREFNELYIEQVNANSELRQQPSGKELENAYAVTSLLYRV